jgi:hypothetical protein
MLVSPCGGDVVNCSTSTQEERPSYAWDLSLDCDWRTYLKQTLLIAVLLFAAANGDASTKLKGKLEESELFWPAHQNNPRPMLWTKCST